MAAHPFCVFHHLSQIVDFYAQIAVCAETQQQGAIQGGEGRAEFFFGGGNFGFGYRLAREEFFHHAVLFGVFGADKSFELVEKGWHVMVSLW